MFPPILDPLEKQWHFVKVNAKGRRSEVSLTDQGRSALRIFRSGGLGAGEDDEEFDTDLLWENVKGPHLPL